MILNSAEAKAVYDAMCALNNVNANIGELRIVRNDQIEVYVRESRFTNAVTVRSATDGAVEIFENQKQFKESYEIE